MQDIRVEQLRVIGVRQQHKTEFAARTQRQSGAQRHAGGGAKEPHDAENQKRFGGHQRHQDHTDPGILHHHAKIEQHADGDEKQPQQHVAKRFDVFFNLMAILGFRNQHPGHERPQRERQAGQFRYVGHAQRHQQHIEHEQLGGFRTRHHVKPCAHHTLPGEQQ